jgi:hypothetical protein
MRNELSTPQLVSHVCPEHGEQLQAPPSMVIDCVCGKRCEIDVAGWVPTQVAQRPGDDIEQLAREAGVPPHRVRVALEQRD